MDGYEIKNFRRDFDTYLTQYGTLKMSKKQFYKYVNDPDCFDIYMSESNKINKAEKLRSKIIQDRKLEVLYITGASGSGKTTAAKYFAGKFNYDYFVSGSGEDFLDGYDMEECIILDDLRGNALFFNEFLKLLDNNTNSSIKSRYYNKDISNCKLIVITSVYKPEQLYKNVLTNEDNEEPIEQYYRRLKHHYIEIQDNGDLDDFELDSDSVDYHKPKNRSLGNIYQIYHELGIDPYVVDDNSIFETLYINKEHEEKDVIDNERRGSVIF